MTYSPDNALIIQSDRTFQQVTPGHRTGLYFRGKKAPLVSLRWSRGLAYSSTTLNKSKEHPSQLGES